MDTLRDALKGALGPADPLQARELPPTQAALEAAEDDPRGSAWLKELARHAAVPAGAKTEALRQLTDRTVKALQAQNRRREAEALADQRDAWLRDQERRTWERVKARFAELELPEKAYRALRQEKGVHAHKVLARLRTRRAEELRGAGAARVREWLLEA